MQMSEIISNQHDATHYSLCSKWCLTSGGKMCKIFFIWERIQWCREVIWTPNKDEMMFWKYSVPSLLRSRPQVPQGCPMGPKFWVKNFSHMMSYRCCFMSFVGLLAKIWSSMPKTYILLCILLCKYQNWLNWQVLGMKLLILAN